MAKYEETSGEWSDSEAENRFMTCDGFKDDAIK